MGSSTSAVPRPVITTESGRSNYPCVSVSELRDHMKEQYKRNVSSVEFTDKRGSNLVIFTPDAWEETEANIHFGYMHANNQYEQQLRACGHYFKREEGGYIVVISHVQKIYAAIRTPFSSAVIEKGKENPVYDQLNRELEMINRCEEQLMENENTQRDIFYAKENPVVPCGWIHTHPNLGAFFSSVDVDNVACAGEEPWVSLCVDPIRRQLKAVSGKKNCPTSILIYYYRQNWFAAHREYHDEQKEEEMEQTEMQVTDIAQPGIPEDLNCLRYYSGRLLSSRAARGDYQEKKGFGNSTKIRIKINLNRRRRKSG